MAYKPIESYGVIGDLHTVALVGMDGSISRHHARPPPNGRRSPFRDAGSAR
jgi:hypothetical protein